MANPAATTKPITTMPNSLLRSKAPLVVPLAEGTAPVDEAPPALEVTVAVTSSVPAEGLVMKVLLE